MVDRNRAAQVAAQVERDMRGAFGLLGKVLKAAGTISGAVREVFEPEPSQEEPPKATTTVKARVIPSDERHGVEKARR